jgi:hypothetical protein
MDFRMVREELQTTLDPYRKYNYQESYEEFHNSCQNKHIDPFFAFAFHPGSLGERITILQ